MYKSKHCSSILTEMEVIANCQSGPKACSCLLKRGRKSLICTHPSVVALPLCLCWVYLAGCISQDEQVHYTESNNVFFGVSNGNFSPSNPTLKSSMFINFSAGVMARANQCWNNACLFAEEFYAIIQQRAKNQQNFDFLSLSEEWQEIQREIRSNRTTMAWCPWSELLQLKT